VEHVKFTYYKNFPESPNYSSIPWDGAGSEKVPHILLVNP